MEFINECLTAFDQYALRSFGIGERGLPGSTNTSGGPINLCNMTVLIGSGMLRNIIFGVVALCTGFFLALSLALLKSRNEWYLSMPARAVIYTFRGTPLLIQFFIGYLIFASLGAGVFRTAAYGASVVLFF
ncbi:MAG: amino acid ABC transporter permease, partial [Alphaproteobacteria bacterium]